MGSYFFSMTKYILKNSCTSYSDVSLSILDNKLFFKILFASV